MSNIPWSLIIGGSVLGLAAGVLLSQEPPRARRNPYQTRKNPLDLEEMQKEIKDKTGENVALGRKSEGAEYLRNIIAENEEQLALIEKALNSGGEDQLALFAISKKAERERYLSSAENDLKDTKEEIKKLKDEQAYIRTIPEKNRSKNQKNRLTNIKPEIEKKEKLVEGYEKRKATYEDEATGTKEILERDIRILKPRIKTLQDLLSVFEEEALLEEE